MGNIDWKQEYLEVLQKRIIKNAHQYYPFFQGEVIVNSIPHHFRSDNLLLLFEVSDKKGNHVEHIIAKRLLEGKTAVNAPRDEYEILKSLFGSRDCLSICSVPRPIDCYDDLRTIIIEKVDGERLTDVLRKTNRIGARNACRKLNEIMFNCGNCLRIIHNLGRSVKTALGSEVFQDTINKIRENREFLLKGGYLNHNIDDMLNEHVSFVLQSLKGSEFDLVRQHGDYYIGNILLKEDHLTVLDFSFTRQNLIYHDISRFLVSLEFLNPYPSNILYDFGKTASYSRSFLAGYYGDIDRITSVDWLMIRIHLIKSILRHWRRRIESRLLFSCLRKMITYSIINAIYNQKLLKLLK